MGVILDWNSNYPTFIDDLVTNFPVLTDGVHDVRASHLNELAAAIIASEQQVTTLQQGSQQVLWKWNQTDVTEFGTPITVYAAGGSNLSAVTNFDVVNLGHSRFPVLRYNHPGLISTTANGMRMYPLTALSLPTRFVISYRILRGTATSSTLGAGVGWGVGTADGQYCVAHLFNDSGLSSEGVKVEGGVLSTWDAGLDTGGDLAANTVEGVFLKETWRWNEATISTTPYYYTNFRGWGDGSTKGGTASYLRAGLTAGGWQGKSPNTLFLCVQGGTSSTDITAYFSQLQILKHPLDTYNITGQ